jgi:hypothetical protein
VRRGDKRTRASNHCHKDSTAEGCAAAHPNRIRPAVPLCTRLARNFSKRQTHRREPSAVNCQVSLACQFHRCFHPRQPAYGVADMPAPATCRRDQRPSVLSDLLIKHKMQSRLLLMRKRPNPRSNRGLLIRPFDIGNGDILICASVFNELPDGFL